MAEYTYKELMKMQNDAIRRAEDMKNRAQHKAGLSAQIGESREITVDKPKRIPMPPNYLNIPENQQKEKPQSAPSGNVSGNAFGGAAGFLKDLSIDSDRGLILSLILLLSQEKADETLIMALLYML